MKFHAMPGGDMPAASASPLPFFRRKRKGRGSAANAGPDRMICQDVADGQRLLNQKSKDLGKHRFSSAKTPFFRRIGYRFSGVKSRLSGAG
jgi:hypothetical protein